MNGTHGVSGYISDESWKAGWEAPFEGEETPHVSDNEIAVKRTGDEKPAGEPGIHAYSDETDSVTEEMRKEVEEKYNRVLQQLRGEDIEERGEINALRPGSPPGESKTSSLTLTKDSDWKSRLKDLLNKTYGIAIAFFAFGGGFVMLAAVALAWPISLPVLAIATAAIYLGSAYASYAFLLDMEAKQEQARLEGFGPSYDAAMNKSTSFKEFAEDEKIKKHFDSGNDGSKGEAAIFLHSQYLREDARAKLLEMNEKLEQLKKLEKRQNELQPPSNQIALMAENPEFTKISSDIEQLQKDLEAGFTDLKTNYGTFVDKVMDKEKLQKLQYEPSKAFALMAAVASGIAEVAKAGFSQLQKVFG